MKTSDISRFWSKVDRGSDDQCWNWTGWRSSNGYGRFSMKRDLVGSHRISALLTFGERKEGMFVLHSCDNKLCCNPKHLRYGTQRDNIQDAMERERYSQGTEVWNAILTEPQVREIWRLHLSGQNTAEIAKVTKSPRYAVVDVCRGRSWRHLKNAPSTDRLAKGGVRRGKLTAEDIKTAKKLIKEGLGNKEIGAILGTSPTPISYLRNYGTTWVPKP